LVASGAVLIGWAGLVLAAGAAAPSADCTPAIAERALAAAASAGDRLRLADGREIRLPAVLAPAPSLTPRAEEAARIEAARAALDKLVAGKTVGISPIARKADRHGRLLAHVALEGSGDPFSLETTLLREGHARVAAAHDRRQCLGPLLAAESQARERILGLWGDPYYAVRRADDASSMSDLAGAYLVAEGRVASVRASGAQVYLNFARRWRDGLSVTIWKPYAARFEGGEDGLRRLEGARVRVRGWLSSDGRPLIAASYPEQIERLAGEAPRRQD
jgi:micrococcal nuclease